ncbi:uncharacterized protein LOC131288422 [Anopheles ziemanni]|uniref:uncharacterized protein LOC131260088 n=1 Tax=Anopheles coustani TaxID=139045 RepID=UPI002657CCBA|nr:uncharacterized protein LOC131260088 [Anopheles coustani]XP_058173537.1 uncharacterized protein LOC131288422 [Anopheles ziemanni]
MQSARPVASLAIRNAAFLARGYHGPSNFRVYTMNDMPVPEGDFFEEHRRKNRVYNAMLGAGIVIFGIAFTVAKESGLIYFNYNPPKSLN